MFNSLKNAFKQPAPTPVNKNKIVELINEAFEDMEGASDCTFLKGYINGLADAAFELGAITMNERAEYKTRAYKVAQARKKQ